RVGAGGGGCPTCQTDTREQERLQVMRVQAGDAAQTAAPAIVHDALSSPGQPLDPATRAFMEPRFGHDFSKVRVHTDERGGESARAVGALAYTVGNDIVFDTGRFTPESRAGRSLLAHELTHVLQQTPGATSLQRQPTKRDPDAERAAAVAEAEAAGRVTEELEAQCEA